MATALITHAACLEHDPGHDRQAAQVVEEAEQAEETDRGRQSGPRLPATWRDEHGGDQADGDRRTAAARRGYRVR